MTDLINTQDKEGKLWNLCWELYQDKSEWHKDEIEKFYNYWDGKYSAPADSAFNDQTKSSCNIIKQIVETELSAILDAQFTIEVVPEVNVFSDLSTIKMQTDYADILHSEVQNVLSQNRWDDIKEKVCRWGLVGGFGATQTLFDTKNRVEGEITVTSVDPRTLRWDKYAKSVKDLTFIAYQIELNPTIAKKLYGQDNDELCKKIDKLADTKSDQLTGQRKNAVAIQSDETADMAYVYETKGIKSGKVVKLIVMFLIDDSVYMPEEGDDEEKQALKQEMKALYPNGRMIVMSGDKENRLILEDRQTPEGMKGLGNIDFFNPTDFDGLIGKGEVEDLIPIQDRINGTYLKVRSLIARHIITVCLDKGLDIEVAEGDLINNAVMFLEGIGRDKGKLPGILDNQSIQAAMQLLDYIEKLKQEARETARLNETAINGVRQKGTTSAEQVEALQESPMASIRSKQRNFKDLTIKVGEKIIEYVQSNYTVQRLIRLATGIDTVNGKAVYAKFTEGDAGRQVELLNEAGEIIQAMKVDKNWKYRVEVSAGTDIPRSRKENAAFIDKLATAGVLDLKDPDILEMYLKANDVQNYRAYSKMSKKKQEEAQKKNPQAKEILQNPVLTKSISDFIDSLKYNSAARSQILTAMGLDGATDKLDTAPAQEVSSKADVKDVVAMSPEVASKEPQKAEQSQIIGTHIIASGRS